HELYPLSLPTLFRSLPWPVLRQQLKQLGPGSSAGPFELAGNPFMLGVAPVSDRGMILVAVPLPSKFTQTLNRLDASRRWYMDVAAQLKQVRRTYIGILLLVTLLVLFAATWLALFM